MEDVAEKGEGNRMRAIDTGFTPRINGFDSHSIGITRPFLGHDLGLKKRDDRWGPPVSEGGERRASCWLGHGVAGWAWLASSSLGPGCGPVGCCPPLFAFSFFLF
jgi:hypothetical protein